MLNSSTESIQSIRPMQIIPTWRLFWAKTDRSGNRPDWTRPLWAHLIDVANVALLLWECYLPARAKHQLSEAVNLPELEAGHWFALQIGLHDLGKAIPSFQYQHAPSFAKLKERGLIFPDRYDRHNRMHHGHATIAIQMKWYKQHEILTTGEGAVIEGLAACIGFHHGKLAHCTTWRQQVEEAIGKDEWRLEQFALLESIIAAWSGESPTLTYRSRHWPAWLLNVAGWCTLADWIGSMEGWFPEVRHEANINEYIIQSRAGAERALHAAGFTYRAALKAYEFSELFTKSDGSPADPRPLQEKIIEMPLGDGPTLTIVEAPTGEGKTEAALYLAARQQDAAHGSGIYIAMPSQATSNGLFSRFESFLKRSHDINAGPVNLVLVHGASSLNVDQERLVHEFIDARKGLSEVYANDEDGGSIPIEPRVETAEWFLPKKRSLLAPYGIGTVDQALLGVLFAKHFFLRLFGLAGKTVIFDEVHAYDTYMSELFCRLLKWLHAGGTNVVLLSATLPDLTRRKFIEAWQGSQERVPNIEGTPIYPAIWHVGHSSSDTVSAIGFSASQSQKATLSWDDPSIEAIAQKVVAAVSEGATVAAIVNTVARAQELFKAIDVLIAESPDLALIPRFIFHARFPHILRREIEATVNARFGKDRPSLAPAILIATQVAEQSLDLDFDYMFSDLAPIDLLLQRAG